MNFLFKNKTTVTKKFLMEYSKAAYRTYHKKYRIFCFVAFLLSLISIAFNLYINNGLYHIYEFTIVMFFASIIFLFMFLKSYIIKAKKNFKNIQNIYGEDFIVTYSFSDNEIQQNTTNSQITFNYANITNILETENLYILMLHNQGLILDKNGFLDTDTNEFLSLIKEKCAGINPAPNIRNTECKIICTVFGCIAAIVSVLLIIMQLGYFLINKKYGFQYIIDNIFYYVNAAILITALLSIILLFLHKKRVIISSISLFAVLFIMNTITLRMFSTSNTSIISTSPDLKHTLLLKEDIKTGKTTSYNNVIFLFARPGEKLPYTVDGSLKTQWLTPDVCAVTYTEPNKKVHQFVSSYGNRGNTISYYYVEAALTGKWSLEGKNTVNKMITADETGITITDGSSIDEHYDPKECVQVSTLGLILCRDGLPQWTIVLNADCKIGTDDLIVKGGTITLCSVSMDKTATQTYVCVSKPDTETSISKEPDAKASNTQKPSTKENGNTPAKILAEQIKQSPDLSNFKSQQDLVAVHTDSSDMFKIGRLALEENRKQFAINGYDNTVQIDELRVTAGNINEFLIEIKSTEKVSNSRESETTDFDQFYRIKKGTGAYLAIRIGYGIDGAANLNKLKKPDILDTSNNSDFHFFVPAEKAHN